MYALVILELRNGHLYHDEVKILDSCKMRHACLDQIVENIMNNPGFLDSSLFTEQDEPDAFNYQVLLDQVKMELNQSVSAVPCPYTLDDLIKIVIHMQGIASTENYRFHVNWKVVSGDNLKFYD